MIVAGETSRGAKKNGDTRNIVEATNRETRFCR